MPKVHWRNADTRKVSITGLPVGDAHGAISAAAPVGAEVAVFPLSHRIVSPIPAADDAELSMHNPIQHVDTPVRIDRHTEIVGDPVDANVL